MHDSLARPKLVLACIGLLAGLVQACASMDDMAQLAELDGAVTSVQDPGLVVPDRGLFTWRAGSHLDQDSRIDAGKLAGMIRGALADALADKGYELGTAETSNLCVGYIAALESAIDDAVLDRLFGVNPEWQVRRKGSGDYEKGTLVVDIVEAETGRGIWRGAVQANVTFDLDDAERRHRIRQAVDMLLSRFRVGH